MQDWVFDRDNAQTKSGSSAMSGQPAPAAPAPSRWRLGRRGRWVVAAGAAVAVLAGGVAVAASPDQAPLAAAADQSVDLAAPQDPGGVPDTETLPGRGAEDGGTTADGTAPSAPWSALHEERQVQQRDGTTLTVAVQGGTITALTGDSVTVESADGFVRSYGVTADTRIATPDGTLADLATGDTVLVEAVVEGDNVTAATIRTTPTPDDGGVQAPSGSTEQDTSTEEA